MIHSKGMPVSGLDAGGYCGGSRREVVNVMCPSLFWKILTNLGIRLYVCRVQFNDVSRVYRTDHCTITYIGEPRYHSGNRGCQGVDSVDK